MNTTQRPFIMRRWQVLQYNLMPELRQQYGALTLKLEKLVHILDWVRIEEWSMQTWLGIGRKPHERSPLANAFVAKAVVGLPTTKALIERITMDRALKRLCGFSMWKQVPNKATFSRTFAEFAQAKLAEHVHEALLKSYLGDTVIGHISRDGTAIEARETGEKITDCHRRQERESALGPSQKRRGAAGESEQDRPAMDSVAAGDAAGFAQSLGSGHELQCAGLQK